MDSISKGIIMHSLRINGILYDQGDYIKVNQFHHLFQTHNFFYALLYSIFAFIYTSIVSYLQFTTELF